MFIIYKQQCNAYIYIFVDFTHCQSDKRICNSFHISSSRDVILKTVIKRKVPHLVFIQHVARHWAQCKASIHIENYSICYLAWLIDSRWAILEDKTKARYGRWPLNSKMVLLRGSSGKYALYGSSLTSIGRQDTYFIHLFLCYLIPCSCSIFHPSIKALLRPHLFL